MSSFIRHPKDFWSGIMFLFFGLGAVVIGQDYPMGTAGRMGPAYFPVVLGAILALIGLAAVIGSLRGQGESVSKFSFREMFLILLSVVLFAALVRVAGMPIAVMVMVMVSAYASERFTWKGSILLAIGSAVFCALVFVKGLGVPLPLVGPWFGG